MNFSKKDYIYYFVFISLIVLFLIGYSSFNRSLWLDESMLFVNLSKIEFFGLLHPLPYYNQSSPLIPLFFQKILNNISDGNFFFIRLFSLLSILLILGCFVLKLPSKISPIIWLLVLSLDVYQFLYYSTEIKHYSYEFISSLMVVLSYFYYIKKEYGKGFILSIFALAIGFSNIIPVGIMLIFILVLFFIKNEVTFTLCKYWFASIFFLSLSYLLMKYLTSYQISHNDVYLSKGLIFDLKTLLISAISIHGKCLTVLTGIALISGLSVFKKNKSYFHFSLFYLLIILVVFLLKLTALYPVIYGRHLYWLIPFSVTLSSFFLIDIIKKNNKLKIFILLVWTILFIFNSLNYINNNEGTANKKLIKKINELCINKDNNLIADPYFSRVFYTYQNILKNGCFISHVNLTKSQDRNKKTYSDIFIDALSFINQDKDNYIVLTHITLSKENKSWQEIEKILKNFKLKYEVVFRDKGVAIINIKNVNYSVIDNNISLNNV